MVTGGGIVAVDVRFKCIVREQRETEKRAA